MSWQITPYTVPLVVSGLLCFAITYFVWQERPKDGATWLGLGAIAVAGWAFGQAGMVSTTDPGLRSLADSLSVLAIVYTPPIYLLFSLTYTGHGDRLGRPLRALLLLEPIAIGAIAFLGGDLMAIDATTTVGLAGIEVVLHNSPAFLLHHLYGYPVLFVAEYYLWKMFLGSRNVFRRRTFFLLALIVVLHFAHFLSVLGLSPTPYHTLTPLGFLLFGALSLLALVSYRAFEFLPLHWILLPFSNRSKNLAPVGRERAIEEMRNGFMVIDHKGRIVDINPVAKLMIGRPDDRVVGKKLRNLLPEAVFVDGEPGFLADELPSGRYDGLWVDPPDGKQRCFDVLVNGLENERGEQRGYVALIHDVTERERRKRKLEERTTELSRQNEQLENFASIVSHDLRNPLNVADNRLEFVDAGDDQEHVDKARSALSRMGDIIDDTLTLARLSQTIDETESVDIAAVANQAWDNVRTPSATLVTNLDVETEATVEASRSRLLQVFENLYRNAIEHGGEDVTVTVGRLDDGFYVADDGPGIPEEHRDEVLDQGFTTEENGTGFGLAIIETIVKAHGWTVTVTEGSEGGARIEITGDDHAVDRSERAVVD